MPCPPHTNLEPTRPYPPSPQHLGEYSFKGVSGLHSVVAVTLGRLEGRPISSRLRKAKADLVAPGHGLLYSITLEPLLGQPQQHPQGAGAAGGGGGWHSSARGSMHDRGPTSRRHSSNGTQRPVAVAAQQHCAVHMAGVPQPLAGTAAGLAMDTLQGFAPGGCTHAVAAHGAMAAVHIPAELASHEDLQGSCQLHHLLAAGSMQGSMQGGMQGMGSALSSLLQGSLSLASSGCGSPRGGAALHADDSVSGSGRLGSGRLGADRLGSGRLGSRNNSAATLPVLGFQTLEEALAAGEQQMLHPWEHREHIREHRERREGVCFYPSHRQE